MVASQLAPSSVLPPEGPLNHRVLGRYGPERVPFSAYLAIEIRVPE